MWTLKQNTNQKKIRFVISRGEGLEGGRIGGRWSKVQTFSNMISTRDVTYNVMTIANTAL